jgi:hypothetical protein
MIILNRNHPHPPLEAIFGLLSSFLRLDSFFDPGPPLDPLVLYIFLASTLMISKLSESSPVSAEKPKYTTFGSLRGTDAEGSMLKHDDHWSSDLYCSCSVKDLSWKYVNFAFVGMLAARRPRALRKISLPPAPGRPTYRASTNLIGLAIIRLIIFGPPVSHHCHDIWEHDPGSIVLVCVEEDPQTLKLVFMTEDWAGHSPIFRDPHCKSIAM